MSSKNTAKAKSAPDNAFDKVTTSEVAKINSAMQSWVALCQRKMELEDDTFQWNINNQDLQNAIYLRQLTENHEKQMKLLLERRDAKVKQLSSLLEKEVVEPTIYLVNDSVK